VRLVAFAALIALATTPAFAHKYTIALTPMCNVGVVTTGGPSKTFLYNETKPQSCNNVIGTGVLANDTVNGIKGKWLVIGTVNFDYPNQENTIFLQYPLATGLQYAVYTTVNGQTLTYLGGGTYTVAGK